MNGTNDTATSAVQLIQIRVQRKGGSKEPQSVVVMARLDDRRASAEGAGKDVTDAVADAIKNVTEKLTSV